MSDILPLDLTGMLASNAVVEERTLTADNRVIILQKGSFYVDSVVITNLISQVRLTKETDYKLVEVDAHAQRMAEGHGICRCVYIPDKTITSVRIEYQAVGGAYQFQGSELANMVDAYINSADVRIVGLPDQYIPTAHINHINNFNKLGSLKAPLARIITAVKSGKSEPTKAALLAYIEALGTNLSAELNAQIADIREDLTFLQNRNDFRDGRYYINSSPINPSDKKGGVWTLEQNVMLYGAMSEDDVGTWENIKAGSGLTAMLKHLWRRDDAGTSIVYDLQASTNNADEGDTIFFTVHVDGLPTGSLVPYRISNVDSNDLSGTPVVGNFVLDANGDAQIAVDILEDRLSEGQETLKLTLVNSPATYVNVTINDTSQTPTYNVWFSSDAAGTKVITSINEGISFYIQLSGTALQQGERVYLLTDGSSTSVNDFTTSLPLYLDYHDGKASALVTIADDHTTEGNEVLSISVCTANNISTRVARANLTILDTSIAATYTAKFATTGALTAPAITQINEGNIAYLVITGTNLVEGTILFLDYSGTVDNADFMAARVSTVTITNGGAIVPYSIANDLRTEGNETLGVTIRQGSLIVASATLTVLDTSITQGFDVWFSTNSAGTDKITGTSEGQTIYLIIRSTGVANGTIYNLTYGTGTDANDFIGTRPTSVTINNNAAYIQYVIANDRLSEGTEIFSVSLEIGTRPTGTITISDTSASPVISSKWSSNANGTDVITSTPEGRTVYLILNVQNMVADEVINLTYSGTAAASDFTVTRPTTATVTTVNGALGAAVPITISNDYIEEGTETLYVTSTFTNAVNTSGRLDILDTSIPVKLSLTATDAQGNIVTSINPGDTITYKIQDVTKMLASDATIYVSILNSNGGTDPLISALYMTTSPPATITLTNWTATFTVVMKDTVPATASRLTVGIGTSADIAKTNDGSNANGVNGVGNLVSLPVNLPGFTAYFTSTLTGSAATNIAADSAVYYVVKSSVVKDGSKWPVKVNIDGLLSTVSNGYVTTDTPTEITFSGGMGYVRVYPKDYAFGIAKPANGLVYDPLTNTTYVAAAASVTIDPPTYTSIPITAAVVKAMGGTTSTDVYNSTNIDVVRAVDLWNYFKAYTGRSPAANESILFSVSSTVAVVGTTSAPAINVGGTNAAWTSANVLKLNSDGLILGMGGMGYTPYGTENPNGGIAISNTGTVVLNVYKSTSSIISGGGGGGGGQGNRTPYLGGGGAPYGYNKSISGDQWKATLTTGHVGTGGSYRGGDPGNGGQGGNAGSAGLTTSGNVIISSI